MEHLSRRILTSVSTTIGKIPDAKPITFRSSWERRLCSFCDEQENVLAYGSEIVKIPYYSIQDGKTHTYITDFVMITKCRDGSVKKFIIEVKPESQTARLDENGNVIMPKPPKRPTQKRLAAWQERCKVIERNNEKWTAARDYCYKQGFIFKIITEKELGIVL